MVYVGILEFSYRGMLMSHMSSPDIEELHKMADTIGVSRKWFQNDKQHPHYDICKSKKQKAIRAGAVEVSDKELIKQCYQSIIHPSNQPGRPYAHIMANPSIYAENNGVNIPKLEDGTYVGRCYQMVEIGTVTETFPGKKPKEMKKVRLAFELPDETYEYEKDGETVTRVRTVSKEFTLSMFESAGLRKFLTAWRGKDFTPEEAKKFDITVLVGVPCLLTIATNDKGYAEIKGAAKLMKGQKAPAQVNPSSVLAYSAWDEQLFLSLPKYVQDKIVTSREYAALKVPIPAAPEPAPILGDGDDDLPF